MNRLIRKRYSTLKEGKKISDKQQIFGVPLKTLLSLTDQNTVPKILRDTCDFLLQHGSHILGIFRINGNIRIVEDLKHDLQSHGLNCLKTRTAVSDIHALASVIKLFIRKIPGGLVPKKATVRVLKFMKMYNEAEMADVTKLRTVLENIPKENRDALHYLCRFLSRIAQKQSQNLMTPQCLGIVFGPCVFRIHQNIQDARSQLVVNRTMELFILHHDRLFRRNFEASIGVSENGASDSLSETNSFQSIEAGSHAFSNDHPEINADQMGEPSNLPSIQSALDDYTRNHELLCKRFADTSVVSSEEIYKAGKTTKSSDPFRDTCSMSLPTVFLHEQSTTQSSSETNIDWMPKSTRSSLNYLLDFESLHSDTYTTASQKKPIHWVSSDILIAERKLPCEYIDIHSERKKIKYEKLSNIFRIRSTSSQPSVYISPCISLVLEPTSYSEQSNILVCPIPSQSPHSENTVFETSLTKHPGISSHHSVSCTNYVTAIKRESADIVEGFCQQKGYFQKTLFTEPMARDIKQEHTKSECILRHSVSSGESSPTFDVQNAKPQMESTNLLFRTTSNMNDNKSQIPEDIHKGLCHVESFYEILSSVLNEQRQRCDRPNDMFRMSNEELLQELCDLRKGLIYFERLYRSSQPDAARQTMKPFYERYRQVKRLLSFSACANLRDNGPVKQIWQQNAMQRKLSAPKILVTNREDDNDSLDALPRMNVTVTEQRPDITD